MRDRNRFYDWWEEWSPTIAEVAATIGLCAFVLLIIGLCWMVWRGVLR